MKYRAIKHGIETDLPPRNSIGAHAWISSKEAASPECRECGAKMQLFLQFDISKYFDVSFKNDSHFVLFMCPMCNEIPSFDNYSGKKLPVEFWKKTEGHFYAALYRDDVSVIYDSGADFLNEFSLEFIEETSNSPEERTTIKIGGEPDWLQDPEHFSCQCGADMGLLAQISENYPFPKKISAPAQPDSFSSKDYCLFLGNEIYIFCCSEQCNDRSVWITVQN